jgi:hypothetical protein
MNDDDIIQRLRNALDEVAAAPSVESTGESIVDAPHVRESFGLTRWIAVAAAVLLIGLATVALVQRSGSSNDDKASASTPAPNPTSTVPASTTDTPRSTLPVNDTGWYSINLSWLTPGTPVIEECCKRGPPPGSDVTMAWGDDNGIDQGLLVMRAKRSNTGGPATLTFSTYGMTKARAIALEKEITEGSGLPYVLPDSSMQLLGNGLAGDGNLVSQAWTNGANTVALSVGDYRGQLDLFTTNAGSVTPTQLGRAAALRFDDDMGTTFVWRPPTGSWATLHIDIGLAKRIDEILAAIQPAPVPTAAQSPTTTTIFASASTYTAKGVTIIDSGKGPMIAFAVADSLPPQGGDVPLANFDWSMVDGEQTVNGTTWGDSYDVTGTWDGHTFTLTGPPTPATHTGTPETPTHHSLTTGCTLEQMKPMLDALGKLDYKALGLIGTGSYNFDGHCGVQVRALFDTPAVRAAMAKVGTDVTLTFAFQPTTPG